MENRAWLANYDEGVPHTIEYPEIPLFELLERAARDYPNNPCTIFKGSVITYREMNDLTDRLAAGLAEIGVKKGDRVGLFVPNTPQFVIAFLAVLKLGGIVVATNPLYTARELEHQVNDAGVEIMIAMTNNYEMVKAVQPNTGIRQVVATNIKEALPPLTRIIFGLFMEKKSGFRVKLRDNDVWMKDLIASQKSENRPHVEVSAHDTAIFQYSGGTTGVPKAAVAAHYGLVANTYQISAWLTDIVVGEEVILLAIPLYHSYGMVCGLSNALNIASAMVLIPDPRNTIDILDNLQKYKCTSYPGVPAMYNAINNNPDVIAGKYDLSTIKLCTSGSAPLLRETKDRFEELTKGSLVEGYGLSEAPVASHINPIDGENPVGSIGLPLPDIDCRIVDLDDGETTLAPGEIGELVMKGPILMTGYHNMPTETANTLRKGWLHTGDIAYMDEGGYFYIVDRKKELIKPGGFQVWPREVEEVIQAYPKVLEVGVAGIPDEHSGEAVKAWIVLKENETADLEEIREWCKTRLAGYKVPKQVVFLDELPKSTVGKILRRELVRMHTEVESN